MLADDLIDLIALALVILVIVLAVAFVLAVALSAPMRRRLRRAVMLTSWATASLLVVAGLGAAMNDHVHVSNLSTNGVGTETETKSQYEVTGYDKDGRKVFHVVVEAVNSDVAKLHAAALLQRTPDGADAGRNAVKVAATTEARPVRRYRQLTP